MELTRVQEFNGWWAKRDDHAHLINNQLWPSGSKVRQYATMAKAQPGVPMVVGCSADSAMQIYVAAAAKQAGVPAIVYTAARKQRSAATQYALDMGAEVNEIGRGAYLSVLRARARDRAKQLGSVVRWDPAAAIKDAMRQCANLPAGAQRVVVPTGSGLTVAGVLAGCAAWHPNVENVLAVCVSGMAEPDDIIAKARPLVDFKRLPRLLIVRSAMDYSKPLAQLLPDGTPLDPYYAAKALHWVGQGDVLWIPGVRPLAAMPVNIQKELAQLQAELHHDAKPTEAT